MTRLIVVTLDSFAQREALGKLLYLERTAAEGMRLTITDSCDTVCAMPDERAKGTDAEDTQETTPEIPDDVDPEIELRFAQDAEIKKGSGSIHAFSTKPKPEPDPNTPEEPDQPSSDQSDQDD